MFHTVHPPPPRRGGRIKDLVVHAISLVARGANRRTFIRRAAAEAEVSPAEAPETALLKMDAPRRMVYGIVYAPNETDTEGDTMTAADIERAAYGFLQSRRSACIDADHDHAAARGYVAESWLVRAGDPMFPAEPEGAWAVGIKVTDPDTWARIERGELKALSLAGVGRREPAPEPEAVAALGASIERLERAAAGRRSVVGGAPTDAPRGLHFL